jgi:hypothetical protein
MLDANKKEGGDWSVYEHAFLALIESRRFEGTLPKALADHGCLLSSDGRTSPRWPRGHS